MAEKSLKQQIQNQTYNLIAQGVRSFPKNNAIPMAQKNNLVDDILNCQKCPLCKTRKHVFVSPTLIPKKFFILCDYPEIKNSKDPLLYADSSSQGVVLKLLEKLKIINFSHFSFALKCIPEKGIPENSLSICASENLKNELALVNPEIILCFGYRSLVALQQVYPQIQINSKTCENSTNIKVSLQAKDNQNDKIIYFLSSSQNLMQSPLWRTQVWQFLEHLKV